MNMDKEEKQVVSVMKAVDEGDDDLLQKLLELPLFLLVVDQGSKEVLHAIAKNKPKCLKILLENGANPNATDGEHFAIHKAILTGNEEIVDLLCRHGANLNMPDCNGQTAGHYAVYHNNLPILLNLIYYNANLSTLDKNAQTVTHYAVYFGNMLMLKTIVMAKANVDIGDKTGKSPLFVAIWRGDIDMIKVLLMNKAATDITAGIDFPPHDAQEVVTPVMFAAAIGLSEGLELLLEAGGDAHLRQNENRRSALFYAMFYDHKSCVEVIRRKSNIARELFKACKEQNVDYVKLLLELKPNMNKTDELGETVATKAASNGDLEILRIVLEAGTEINLSSDLEFGKSPLMAAAFNGRHDCLKLLLERDAAVDKANEYGRTALWHAADQGRTECIYTLLKAGANADLASEDGTPLMAAVERSKSFKTLLEHGCDVNYVTAKGDCALTLATQQTSDHSFNHLMKHKPNVNVVDGKGWSPVMLATSKKKYHRLKTLLDCGANHDHVDSEGMTALHLAAQRGFSAGMRLLLSYKPELNILAKNQGCHLTCTPLTTAIKANSRDCVILLLKHGAIASVPNNSSLMRTMTNHFQPKLIKALHAAGADPESLPDIVYRGDDMKPVPSSDRRNKELNHPTDIHDHDHDKSLFNICRLQIRQHLFQLQPYNLFRSVSQLPLPSIIQSYLLFNVDLNEL